MASPLDNQSRLTNAINQIQNKTTIPQIDFTIHKLEDGNTISTQERVIKEVYTGLATLCCHCALGLIEFVGFAIMSGF